MDVYTLADGSAEVLEGEVLETSPLSGKTLSELDISNGVVVGAIIHQNEMVASMDDYVIKSGDRIVLLAERESLKHVEQLFRVSMDYF